MGKISRSILSRRNALPLHARGVVEEAIGWGGGRACARMRNEEEKKKFNLIRNWTTWQLIFPHFFKLIKFALMQVASVCLRLSNNVVRLGENSWRKIFCSFASHSSEPFHLLKPQKTITQIWCELPRGERAETRQINPSDIWLFTPPSQKDTQWRKQHKTYPAGDVVDDEMIQSRFECLLMSDDAFCAVAIQLITSAIALTVHDTEASDKEDQVEKRLQLHVVVWFVKLFKSNKIVLFWFFFSSTYKKKWFAECFSFADTLYWLKV